MPRSIQIRQKTRILIWQQIPLLKNAKLFQIKFKIRISQLIYKIAHKPRSLNQIKHYLTEHIQIWHHFFIKKYQSISMTFKIKVFQFYKVNPRNWNKMRHFSMEHIQIWCHAFFYQKILEYFNDFQNLNFSILWLKWT